MGLGRALPLWGPESLTGGFVGVDVFPGHQRISDHWHCLGTGCGRHVHDGMVLSPSTEAAGPGPSGDSWLFRMRSAVCCLPRWISSVSPQSYGRRTLTSLQSAVLARGGVFQSFESSSSRFFIRGVSESRSSSICSGRSSFGRWQEEAVWFWPELCSPALAF